MLNRSAVNPLLNRAVAEWFTFLLLMFAVSDCFALEGGGPAAASQSKGVVAISFRGSLVDDCTGVLLEPDKVLTTLRCLDVSAVFFSASAIRVHPLVGDEVGRGFISPLGDDVPFVDVSSVIFHPNSTNSFGPFNLAILTLSENLDIPVADIYGGSASFIGTQATSFGWEEVIRSSGPLEERSYGARTLVLPPLIEGDSDSDVITGCFDSFEDTDTVFCAGFKNATQFLESTDQGAPLLAPVGGTDVVIGLLSDASDNGLAAANNLEFRYEKFARISSMQDFILENAPNTNFIDETDVEPEPEPEPGDFVIAPIIDLLLSN